MSEMDSSLQYHRSVGTSSPSLTNNSVDGDYTPEFNLGMRPEVKQLYRTDERAIWGEWNPDKVRDDVEAGSYTQECALVVRHEPHPSNGNRAALHSITVQSPLVKNVLDRVFQGFEGVNTHLQQVTFKAPFHSFFYRWHRLEKVRQDEQHQETKIHLDLLHDILDKEIRPHITAMQDFTKNRVITFEYLWTFFVPGMELYTNIDGQDRLVLLRESKYGVTMSGEFFSLECQYIDCNGLNFGYVETSVEINSFQGVKKLTNLDAFPCHFHPGLDDLIERLHTCGSVFEQLNGLYHMAYSGFFTARSSRQVRKRHVENGRIVIDPQTFNIHGRPGPNLEPLDSGPPMDSNEESSFARILNVVHQASRDAYEKYQEVLRKYEMVEIRRLSSRQRLLCTSFVRGYCLTSKCWAEFDVQNVHPVRWSENAFAKLVLPPGYKEIIRAFVQEQLSRDDGFDDIISGKGLGFMMLLSGEPGVGKTLTAESVAEEMHQPLYSMSAGELGETATEIEDSLELVLELTSKWNAILLLDECDIFLEARTTANIQRNRLVSIFLKKLEYYQGIMFLTTNRIRDFDAAFESRIHLTIHYPALDIASRLHIWKTFVEMGNGGNSLSEREMKALAGNEMNGRQIKNIVKTGRLLARQQKVPLAMEHIEMVLKIKKGEFR